VIQHRLAQLSPIARSLAALAAAIGRAFTFTVLVAASNKNEDEVVNGLDELWQRHVIQEQGSSAYDFSHDRIREAAYAELSSIRRKQLHRQVAQALETVYTNDTDPVSGQLALHYERSELFAQAIDWYARAAQVAWDLHAFHDTVNYFRSALRLIPHLPATAVNKRHALALQIEFAKSLTAITGFTQPEYRQILLEAGALTRELQDMDLLADVLSRLTGVYIATGDIDGIDRCANEALSILELVGQAKSKADIYGLLASIARHRGDFDKSKIMLKDRLQQLKIAYEATRERSVEREIIGARMLLAITLWLTGFPQQAWQLIQTYLAQRGQTQEPFRETILMFQASLLLRNLGVDPILAKEATEMLTLGTQYDIALSRQSGAVFSGWLLAKQGQLAEGIVLTRQGVDGFRRMGHSMFQTHRLAMLVEMLLWAEEYAQADALLEEALAISAHCAERFWDVELHRLRGDLLLAQHAPDAQVEAAYLRAIAIAQHQGAKSLELRATTALCRLLQRQGRIKQAHQALADIYGWFTEGFDTHDLRTAQTLLTALQQ
jgi:predicted ATPase